MKFEKNIYKNLIKYFIITFFILSFVFVFLYVFVFMRADKKNAKKEFNEINHSFTEILDYNEKFFIKNKKDIERFIQNKDSDFITEAYKYRQDLGLDFSFLAFDNNYHIGNDITIRDHITNENMQYIDILLPYHEDGKYYSYRTNKSNSKIIYMRNFDSGTLCLQIDGQSLFNILNKKSKNFIIANKYNKVITMGSNIKDDFDLLTIDQSNEDFIRIDSLIRDFKIILLQKKFFNVDLLIFILSILTIISLVYIVFIPIVTKKVSKNISLSLNNLIDQIKLVSEGKIKKININSEDETKYIGDNINTLINNVKKLEANNISLKYEKKASDLKTMESQFNPHFLYNTLDIISYQMYIDKEVCQVLISNLSKLLRYSINNMSFVYLEEDLEYIKLYMQMQKIKYKENLEFNLSVEDDLLATMVPKLFIQPILENSFKYGFLNNENLKIDLNIYRIDQDIFIDIIDSGKALSSDEILKLNKTIDEKSEDSFLIDDHHGLENTLKRLKILYKDTSLKFIESDKVKVRITFRS